MQGEYFDRIDYLFECQTGIFSGCNFCALTPVYTIYDFQKHNKKRQSRASMLLEPFYLQTWQSGTAVNVDHNILLGRLRDCIGLHGSALEWCQSYLTNRPEYVRVGNASSSPVFHDYAVPQGSVLGPQWFTIYTYPIHNIILKYGLMYHIYADDTQLYICFNPTQSSATMLLNKLKRASMRFVSGCRIISLS